MSNPVLPVTDHQAAVDVGEPFGWTVTPIDQVEVTYQWLAYLVTVSWPERTRSDTISSTVEVVRLDVRPPRLVWSPTRINWLSATAKTSLIRSLQTVDKGIAHVDEFVHRIAADIIRRYRQGGTSTVPAPRRQNGARYTLYPLWPSIGGTLVSAATNSFKSWIGIAAAVQCTLGVEVLTGNTSKPTPQTAYYLDWETDEQTFAERLYAVLEGAGQPLEPCVAYRQMLAPLADTAESVAGEIARNGYGAVIVDSLSAAIGGSLNDDEPARQFWNSLTSLRVPVLVLAHKSSEAIRKGWKQPFGSVQHRNRPRMIWDAVRQEGEPLVRWEVVDDNNSGRKGQRLAWRIDIATEGEHEDQRLSTVTFSGVNPNDVRIAANDGDTLADKIAYALINGPATPKELAEQVGITDSSVRKVLSRYPDLFTKDPDGFRWTLKTH